MFSAIAAETFFLLNCIKCFNFIAVEKILRETNNVIILFIYLKKLSNFDNTNI